MWLPPYAKRVDADLHDWEAKGWVTETGASAIRASLETDDRPSRMPIVFAVLGAILLGFSAMAFVAANWADMSKGFRLGLLATTMWTAYGIAAFLLMRKLNAFAEAALIVGIGVFGANIMLIGQMYHLPADFPAGLLTWGLGALAVCLAANSKSSLIAAQLLFGGWSLAAIDAQADPHWLYLVSWLVTGGLALYLNARPAKHLAMVGFYGWTFINIPSFAEATGWPDESFPVLLLGMFALGWLAAIYLSSSERPFTRAAQIYGAISTLVMFWVGLLIATEEITSGPAAIFVVVTLVVAATAAVTALQSECLRLADAAVFAGLPFALLVCSSLSPGDSTSLMWLTAPLFFGVSIWLVIFGTRQQDKILINLGFAAFGLEVIYVYLETFGTLLDTAAFFALGGLLLIGGGIVWERLRRRITSNEEASA